MNQVSEDGKSRVLKTLAVIGFVVLVILAVWLAVKIVQMIPGAFASLAGMAENLNEGRQAQSELVVEANSETINTGQSLTISWSDLNRAGAYAFGYRCEEGVSAEARVNNEFVDIECDTLFVLPSDTHTMDLRFDSEKERFTDIDYRIVFIRDGMSEPTFTANDTVTVVNAAIPDRLAATDEESEPSSTAAEEEADEKETTDVNSGETDEPNTPTTPPVTYRTVTTYQKPVSDPNGYTDLAVRFLGLGYVSSNHTFVNRNAFEEGESGAFQFEVKNIGTKTSTAWRFEAELPEGDIFKSKTQSVLKPNEHAILTVAFPDAGESGSGVIAAEIFGGGDINGTNDGFRKAVRTND